MATSYPEVTNPDFQLDFPKIKDDLIKNPLNIVREDLGKFYSRIACGSNGDSDIARLDVQ